MPILPKRYRRHLPDIGNKETEILLGDLIAEIEKVYGQAHEELQKKADDYLLQFTEMDKKKRKQWEKGEITKQEYQNWRKNKILTGQRWRAMSQTMVDNLANSNGIAASIINGYLPTAYAINGNYMAYMIEHETMINTSFTLFNEQAVERLIREKPDLLPKAKIDIPKDTQWNKQNMISAVMQSIIQGESIEDLAKRLASVTDMNETSSVRNARTMITSAQNAGREDQYRRAESMGIKLSKCWIATLDHRTRASHIALDGEIIKEGETFSNGLEYPGDMNGDPREVYNCRCRTIAIFEDQDFSKFERHSRLGEMSYEQWKNSKGDEPEFKFVRNAEKDKAIHKEYKLLLGDKVPRDFSDFQELKYKNPTEWKKLKAEARKERNKQRK